MPTPEQFLGTPKDPGNASLFDRAAFLGSTSGVIKQITDGLANNYRDPKWPGNPDFDPRPRRTSAAGGTQKIGGLYRGYITQLRREFNEIPGSGGKKRRTVAFQYNPTQIAINYSINTDVFPSQSRSSDDTAPILGMTGQTISWRLYFNRTYEMLGDSEGAGKKVGVMADIQALEYLAGSYGDGQGMAAVECGVVFGMTKSQKPLAFAGWISDFNVEFLQFTNRMMPTVAMVEIGMVRRFIAEGTASDASGPYNVANAGVHSSDAWGGGQSRTARPEGRVPGTGQVAGPQR